MTIARIRAHLATHHIDPLGTSLIVGGIVAIFGFVVSLLFGKLLELPDLGFIELMNLIMGMMAMIFFLFEQGFEARIVAFAPRWVVPWLMGSWLLFLTFIIGGVVAIVGSPNTHALLSWFRLFALAFISCGIVVDLSRVFFESGLSKMAAIALWTFLGGCILLLPWMTE